MAIVPYTGADTRGLVGDHANSEEWNAITDQPARISAGVGNNSHYFCSRFRNLR